MKIITDKDAYIQKYYFQILIKSSYVTGVGVPISMYDVTEKRIFDKLESKDFIKFTKKEEIKFLNDAKWIPDFNDYIQKSVEEVKNDIEVIDNKVNKLNVCLKKIMEEEQKKDYKKTLSEIIKMMDKQESLNKISIEEKMLMYKRESLTDIIKMKEENKIPDLGNRSLSRLLFKK